MFRSVSFVPSLSWQMIIAVFTHTHTQKKKEVLKLFLSLSLWHLDRAVKFQLHRALLDQVQKGAGRLQPAVRYSTAQHAHENNIEFLSSFRSFCFVSSIFCFVSSTFCFVSSIFCFVLL